MKTPTCSRVDWLRHAARSASTQDNTPASAAVYTVWRWDITRQPRVPAGAEDTSWLCNWRCAAGWLTVSLWLVICPCQVRRCRIIHALGVSRKKRSVKSQAYKTKQFVYDHHYYKNQSNPLSGVLLLVLSSSGMILCNFLLWSTLRLQLSPYLTVSSLTNRRASKIELCTL